MLRWLVQLKLESNIRDRVESIRHKKYLVEFNGVKTENISENMKKGDTNYVRISLNPDPIYCVVPKQSTDGPKIGDKRLYSVA